MNPEFKKLYQEDEQVKELIDMSKRRLEGLPRHTSMHACGSCDRSACDRRIRAIVSWIGRLSDDTVYDDNTGRTGASENGFPWASYPDRHTGCRASGKHQQRNKTIDINKIDYDDKAVLASIGTGKDRWRIPA